MSHAQIEIRDGDFTKHIVCHDGGSTMLGYLKKMEIVISQIPGLALLCPDDPDPTFSIVVDSVTVRISRKGTPVLDFDVREYVDARGKTRETPVVRPGNAATRAAIVHLAFARSDIRSAFDESIEMWKVKVPSGEVPEVPVTERVAI